MFILKEMQVGASLMVCRFDKAVCPVSCHIATHQLYKHRTHHYNARSFEVPGV